MIVDYVMTIDSDGEDDSAPVNPTNSKKRKGVLNEGTETLNPDFTFDLNAGDVYADVLAQQVDMHDIVQSGSLPVPISVDNIIARRKLNNSSQKRKREVDDDGSDVDEEEEEEEDGASDDGSRSESEMGTNDEEEDPLASSDDEGVTEEEDHSDGEDDNQSDSSDATSEDETQAQKDRKAAFFAESTETTTHHSSFLTMNLSRPILKAITSLNFSTPTPIQAATIPVALLGKDVVGNAVTGSGKTAAFIVPVLERLLYRDKAKRAAATRCVVLVPTRELAVQCFEVGTKLAAFTDIRLCLVVGGLSVKAQELSLRSRPDVVIATPGRLIDHLRNSPSFSLDSLDILILDEADRMLDDGFADELSEIVKACPVSRQTMLFSATMTDSVDELVKMSLDRPVRLFVDPKRATASGLVQEFVRVRAEKENERNALLVTLCKRTFKERVIVFYRSKKLAHQMRVMFGLLGLKAEELHGDLTQEQRLKSLQAFRDGAVDYLMATDLASRGLDIKGIETVINFDMPGQLAQYLHRVGRTARAGKKGRSVTLVGEGDRRMLKAAIKHSAGADQIRHRVVPAEATSKWVEILDGLKQEVVEVLKEEVEEKSLRKAEMELKKGQNMLEHEKEIFSRPARSWFQTGKEKAKAEELSKQQYEDGFKLSDSKNKHKGKDKDAQLAKPKRDKFSGLSRRVKRRKMAMEGDEEHGDAGVVRAAIRSAKKAGRPTKIGLPEPKPAKRPKQKERKKRAPKGAAFERDLGDTSRREGARAKKSDAIGGLKKKKGARGQKRK